MGSIKKKVTERTTTEHTLTEPEFNYIMNAQTAKQRTAEEYSRIISAFLMYISNSRLGYTDDTALQFEIDFADEKHVLKVTALPPDK